MTKLRIDKVFVLLLILIITSCMDSKDYYSYKISKGWQETTVLVTDYYMFSADDLHIKYQFYVGDILIKIDRRIAHGGVHKNRTGKPMSNHKIIYHPLKPEKKHVIIFEKN